MGAYINNTNSSAGNEASMATNLTTEGALKRKMKKKKKIIRKQNDMKVKIENSRECATIAVRRGI